MKRAKIIIKNKNKLRNTEDFIREIEKEIEFYINEGYEIKASNMAIEGQMYSYVYVLLEKND